MNWKLWNPLRLRKRFRIVRSCPEWLEADRVNLNNFLLSTTGRKLIARMWYSFYEMIISVRPFSERDDGKRIGMSMLINGMENLGKTEKNSDEEFNSEYNEQLGFDPLDAE